MATTDSYEGWIGRTAVDRNGDKIGTITDIYYDDGTDQPEWITVKTGLLGTRSTFVPLHGSDSDGEHLRLPFDKAQVKDAPNIDTDGSLSPDEERMLYDHYDRTADDTSTSAEDEPDGTGRGGSVRGRLRRHVAAAEEPSPEPTGPAEGDGDDRRG